MSNPVVLVTGGLTTTQGKTAIMSTRSFRNGPPRPDEQVQESKRVTT
jgi:hypothetical protein